MDTQNVHDNMQGVKQLTLAQITKAFRLKKSTVNYVAKRSDRLRDMPPEAAPGRTRKFELEQGVRFVAAVMLVRGGVPLDIAGPLLDRIEGIVDAANRTEKNDASAYRYSVGYQVDSGDPWKLTIRDDLVVEIVRKHAMETQGGVMLNAMTPFIVTTGDAAGDAEFDTPVSEFVLNLTEIEGRLAGLTNAKS